MKALANISMTCQAWYEIAKSTHSLWTKICIAPGDAGMPPYGRLTRLKTLRRRLMLCGPVVPLDIDITIPEVVIDWKTPDVRPLYGELVSTVLAGHSHIRRLHITTKSLCFDTLETRLYCIHGIADMLRTWLLANHPPILKELEVIFDGVRSYRTCPPSSVALNAMSFPPCLEAVSMDGALIRSVDLSSWAELRELRIFERDWSMGSLMDALKTCHRLEVLGIQFPRRPTMNFPAITLSSLRSLTLCDAPKTEAPLPFYTPALQHLKVRGYSHRRFQYDDLVSLLGHPGMDQVLSLDFEEALIDADCLRRMVGGCTMLTALSFYYPVSDVGIPPILSMLSDSIQRPDSPFRRLSVYGSGVNVSADKWKKLKELARGRLQSRGRDYILFKFRPSI
jgi:hypothetical protein